MEGVQEAAGIEGIHRQIENMEQNEDLAIWSERATGIIWREATAQTYKKFVGFFPSERHAVREKLQRQLESARAIENNQEERRIGTLG
jgi:hypothetical protein